MQPLVIGKRDKSNFPIGGSRGSRGMVTYMSLRRYVIQFPFDFDSAPGGVDRAENLTLGVRYGKYSLEDWDPPSPWLFWGKAETFGTSALGCIDAEFFAMHASFCSRGTNAFFFWSVL